MNLSNHSLKTILGGISALVLTIGIARFSYTPLLPIMQAQVEGFSDFRGGILAAFNYLGYLSGAIIAALLSDIHLKDRLYRWSLPVAVLSTGAMSLTTDFTYWVVFRTISGFTSAAGLVLCSGLIMNYLTGRNEKFSMGMYFSGVGLGLAFSATAVVIFTPYLDWQEQWLALCVFGLPLAWLAHRWVPYPTVLPQQIDTDRIENNQDNSILLLQLAYFCAGFGYVVSATFLVDMLSSFLELSKIAGLSWILVGLIATPSCVIWEKVANKSSELKALILAYLLQITGILMLVVNPTPTTALVYALLFGGTFMGIVSLVLTMSGRFYPNSPAKPMGKLTLSFVVAQIIGPVCAGWLAETFGNYDMPMLMAAVVLALGIWPLYVLLIGKGDKIQFL